MEWRKPPRLVIHPCVSPRFDVGPVAVVIGGPIRIGGTRKPHGAVFRGGTPLAVIVEIVITDDVGGNVLRGPGISPRGLARGSPVIKLFVIASVVGLCVQLTAAAEGIRIVIAESIGGAFSRHFACTAANSYCGRVPGLVHANPVNSGAL